MEKILAKKFIALKSIFKQLKKVIVAFSGGVDSTLLLKVGTDVLYQNCIGVIGYSPSISNREYEQAIKVASDIGAVIEVIETNELTNPLYIANDNRRCFYCKQELFTKIKLFAKNSEINYIIDGTNYDDRLDYRPGMDAARSLNIISPLVDTQLGKSEIRQLSKYLNLPTWEKPEQPCLSSRVAYGQKIDSQILAKLELAENKLKDMDFKIVRVRYFGSHISIEVGQDEINRLFSESVKTYVTNELYKIGFAEIRFDKFGYKKGKLNQLVNIK